MSDSKALLELAERVEQASGPDQELMLEAYALCFPWAGGGNLSKAYADYWGAHDSFVKLLDAEASLDAAMKLVPEGHVWAVRQQDSDKPTRQWYAELKRGFDTSYDKAFPVWAATPALALTAAALRARAGGSHD